jgi:hypothetical protein
MTCVAARHLSDDSRQRTPRWSLTPVRQASLINLPGRGSLRSGIFRRQNPVVARIPADADPAVRFILKTARGVLASRQLQVNANLAGYHPDVAVPRAPLGTAHRHGAACTQRARL